MWHFWHFWPTQSSSLGKGKKESIHKLGENHAVIAQPLRFVPVQTHVESNAPVAAIVLQEGKDPCGDLFQ